MLIGGVSRTTVSALLTKISCSREVTLPQVYGLFLSKAILSITGIGIRETGVPGKGARVRTDLFSQAVQGPT